MAGRNTAHVPSYRLHKPSGRAVVRLDGRDIYLGRHGTPESHANYNRVISEWAGNLGRLPFNNAKEPASDLTINEVFLSYWEFAQHYYRKYGKPTSEVYSIKRAMVPLLNLYGGQVAGSFGPLALKTYRQTLIDKGLARGVINNHVGRVKRFFKWATENELVPPSLSRGLRAVTGLRRGRSPAPESERIKPVPEALVDAVLRHVNRYIAAMIQLQRFTGMRPCEVTIMRGCDLDKTGKVWVYEPEFHKTEHHDLERLIYLGPLAQQVVKPFLLDNLDGYLFSPRRAMEEHRRFLRANRKTPLRIRVETT